MVKTNLIPLGRVQNRKAKTYNDSKEMEKRVRLSLRGPKGMSNRIEERQVNGKDEKGVWIFSKLTSFMTGYSCWIRRWEPVVNRPEKTPERKDYKTVIKFETGSEAVANS